MASVIEDFFGAGYEGFCLEDSSLSWVDGIYFS